MVQTGDPTGTGKGGTSIWGKKFPDQFHETLKVGKKGKKIFALFCDEKSLFICIIVCFAA